jgi:hypothetical protein
MKPIETPERATETDSAPARGDVGLGEGGPSARLITGLLELCVHLERESRRRAQGSVAPARVRAGEDLEDTHGEPSRPTLT